MSDAFAVDTVDRCVTLIEVTHCAAKAWAAKVWNDPDYDVVDDPEQIVVELFTVVHALAEAGWLDFHRRVRGELPALDTPD